MPVLTKLECQLASQLVSNVLREDLLFEVGHAYEQATDWHNHMPKL